MTNQEFTQRAIRDKGPHAALVAMVAKMRLDEVSAILMSAANPIPTTVTWNLLRDTIIRERIAAEENEA